jgi:PDZ domain
MLAGLLILPLVTGCGEKEETETAVVKFDTPWSSEEHWMVSSIVADLHGLAELAGGKTSDAAANAEKDARVYQVGGVGITMAPSCWDIASYRPLLETWKPVAASSAGAGPELTRDLLTPSAKVLQKANDSISRRIKAAPGDPLVHEEAAFLLGVFGQRENARGFSDVRMTLCRMTAHLALAEYLRGGAKPSLTGEWARVLYDCHAGRPRQARERAATIPQEGDSGRWKRVVDLTITGDWRRTGDLDDPSLAEAIAHVRALKDHRGNPQMMEFVSQHKEIQAIPEWSRLLAAGGKSVEEGHTAMRSGLAMEFLEISEVFPTGKNPKPDRLAKYLTLTGRDKIAGAWRVIPDGDWAAYFRRHVFAMCGDVSRFAIRLWGSDEAAVEWEEYVLGYSRLLPGHELVEPLVSTRAADFQKDMRATVAYTLKQPEQVPMGLWFDYRFPSLNVSLEVAMPDQKTWFREVSPPGTAHEPCQRIRFTGIQGGDWIEHITALHQMDPWDSELCFELAENTGNDMASVRKAWGDVREYSVRPLRQTLMSPKLTPDERIETLRTLAPLDPDEGFELGQMLVMTGRPDEAIQAFEAAYKDSPDRVSASNQTQWMIYYYKSKGDDKKAREIADHNEEVFSQRGLVSALTLAVVEKDSARAKKLARDIEERYGDSDYLPVAAWDEGKNEKLLRGIFPEGIKTVALADFPEGSKDKGPRVANSSLTLQMAGMRPGDVVLAIDGKRVENFQQYFMLLATDLEPKVRIIYRRGKKVAEVECLLPQRRLDCGMN